MSPSIRAVVFDLDGTLLDTHRDLATGVNAALRALGHEERSEDAIRRIIGRGVHNLLATALDVKESDPIVHVARKHFDRAYLDAVAKTSVPYPGVPELLRTLAARGLSVGVATNKSSQFTLPLLRAVRLPEIEAVACSDEVPRRKPAPDVLALCCTRLDAFAAETVFVGDSQIDEATADAFGCRFLGVAWGFRPESLRKPGASDADEWLRQFEEIQGPRVR